MNADDEDWAAALHTERLAVQADMQRALEDGKACPPQARKFRTRWMNALVYWTARLVGAGPLDQELATKWIATMSRGLISDDDVSAVLARVVERIAAAEPRGAAR
jgi:hypothetical protein